jgi:hypothetical protein
MPYVGWATSSRVTMMTHLYMFKKEKEKEKGRHNHALVYPYSLTHLSNIDLDIWKSRLFDAGSYSLVLND